MAHGHGITRRGMVGTGLAALAGGALSPREALASYKAPGETRVVFLGGDYYHNGATQEYTWRYVLRQTDWRLMFAQSARFITPEVLANTDLFVMTRYSTDTQPVNISLEWTPDMFIEERPAPTDFMTDEQEEAFVENVRRGMGFLAMHCSIWNPGRTKYLSLLGAEKPVMHTKVQPATVHELNPDHPITRGIEPFSIGDDEIFNAEMKEGEYELLFRTTGEEQPINAYGGWCRTEGGGRVVALLPGHTTSPWVQPSFRKIMWRSAHWALGRGIPSDEHIAGGFS